MLTFGCRLRASIGDSIIQPYAYHQMMESTIELQQNFLKVNGAYWDQQYFFFFFFS